MLRAARAPFLPGRSREGGSGGGETLAELHPTLSLRLLPPTPVVVATPWPSKAVGGGWRGRRVPLARGPEILAAQVRDKAVAAALVGPC